MGTFLESDPSQPLSWAFMTNFSSMNAAYTLEKHRRKGYSRITMLCLLEKVLKNGMIPLGGVDIQNTPPVKMFADVGLVEAFDTTWMLYS